MQTRDGHIVYQCLSGNTEAFALLVDKYKERIFALVYAKVGQFQDAEDITQDVFLNAYKKLSTLRRWDNFYPWLYSIAANRCKNFYRAQIQQVETMNLLARNPNHQPAVDADSETVRIKQLHEALDSLPEMHRQVLMLRYMAGMKSKEIAQTLRVSPNTIDQRLVRARAKLKTILNEEMIPMIRTTLAERKLQPGFTARVVEFVRDAKIQTAPHKTALPFGLSVAGGLILLLLSLSLPSSPLYPLGEWLGGSMPLKTQVVEDGELPVDAEATRVAILGAEGEDGDFGQKPEPLKTPAAIGQLEEMDNPNEEVTVTSIHLLDDSTWHVDVSHDGKKMVYVSRQFIQPEPSVFPKITFKLVVHPLVASTDAPPEPTVLLQEDGTGIGPAMWSPDGKWIAFYRHENSHAAYLAGEKPPEEKDIDVYLIPGSGGEMRFLVTTGSKKFEGGGLSWSPDSKELAFVKGKGKNADIYIVSIDTGVVRPFTTDGKENSNPSWSSNGKWISYRSRRGVWFSDGSRSWRQPVTGGRAIVNERLGTDPPIHSPDGKWVAYTGRLPDEKSGFIAARVNEQGELAGEPIFLKAASLRVGAMPLRWTPDGKIFVLQEDYGEMTYALNTETGEQHRLSSEPEFSFDGSLSAEWVDDGKSLFLPSGTDRKPGFLDLKTSEFVELPIEVSSVERIRSTTLSPDKRAVAFTHFDPNNVEPITIKETVMSLPKDGVHVHTMPVTGGQIRQLTDGNFSADGLCWSPDGQNIAFISGEIAASGTPASQLYVVSVSDGQINKLTDSGLHMEVAWSPDGRMLAYLRLREKGKRFNPEDMEGDLYVVPATGGESKRITNSPEKEMGVSWTPDGKWLTFMIEGEAWVASIDGGEPKKLQRNYIPSSWSSDGTSYLAFGRNGELQRISLNGKTIDELPIRVPTDARPLSMSPHGETILYRRITAGTQCWSIDVSHLVNQ